MVRNITAEETTAGTEISWEPPDEISDIKEKDRNSEPPVWGCSHDFGPRPSRSYLLCSPLKSRMSCSTGTRSLEK